MLDVWLSAGLCTITAALAAFLTFPPKWYVATRRRNFAEWTGAYVDPSFAAVVDRDTRRLTRMGALVVVAMTASAEASSVLDPGVPTVSLWLWLSPLVAVWMAAVAMVRLRAAGREFTVPESHKAVARPRRVVLSDYVRRLLQVSTWFAVAVVLALAAAVVVAWRRGDATGVVALVGVGDAAVTVGMAAFTVWFGTALCERPTPAVDASHLYLHDAWQASALSGAHGFVAGAAYVSFLGLLFAADLPWLESAVTSILIYPLLAVVLLVVLQQRQRFRRRLWRTLPPGQVLLPGQPPPPFGAGA